MMSIDDLAAISKNVGDSLFPGRTDASMFLKLYSEIAEMIESGGAPDEVADVFIMLLDYAARKCIRIEDAVMHKMRVNANREWELTESGVYQHVA